MAVEALEAPQTMPFATAIGFTPEQNSKTIFLKTPLVHALTAGHGEIKLRVNWKLLPCGMTFTVPEGTVHGATGELSTTFPLGSGPCLLNNQQARQDVPACVIVVLLP